MEDYPSPAEGNGLENRQACKSVRGFESHILLIHINAGWSSSVAQLVEQWIEAPCVGGSIPSRAIYFDTKRVKFSGKTTAFQAVVASSILVARFIWNK